MTISAEKMRAATDAAYKNKMDKLESSIHEFIGNAITTAALNGSYTIRIDHKSFDEFMLVTEELWNKLKEHYESFGYNWEQWPFRFWTERTIYISWSK